MKKLIVAGTFAVLLASPAVAQPHHHKLHAKSHATQTAPVAAAEDNMNGPQGQIIWGGKLRGQDPDPFIRSEISRGLGNYGAD
jgi:hypothetical protein